MDTIHMDMCVFDVPIFFSLSSRSNYGNKNVKGRWSVSSHKNTKKKTIADITAASVPSLSHKQENQE